MGETEKELASSNISTCSLGFSDREEENDKMTKLHKKVQFLLNWISTSDRVFLPDCSLFLALSWMVGGYHVSDARKVWKRSPSPLELLFSLLDKTFAKSDPLIAAYPQHHHQRYHILIFIVLKVDGVSW